MEALILPNEQFQELLNRVDEIRSAVTNKSKKPEDSLITNEEFLQLMNISKRTAQAWRDKGVISFSQVGGKIYYRMSEVERLMNENHKPAFKLKSKSRTNN